MSLTRQAAGNLHLFCELVMVLVHTSVAAPYQLYRDCVAVSVLKRFSFHNCDARLTLAVSALYSADGTW